MGSEVTTGKHEDGSPLSGSRVGPQASEGIANHLRLAGAVTGKLD